MDLGLCEIHRATPMPATGTVLACRKEQDLRMFLVKGLLADSGEGNRLQLWFTLV